MRTLLPAVVSFVLAACRGIDEAAHYDIGTVHRAVTTSSPTAQLWFDRGLAFCYGFHHEAAVRCFDRAIVIEPGFAMAHWGKAYALGPNYNMPEVSPEACASAHAAALEARRCAAGCTEIERGLVAAMLQRIPGPDPGDRAAADRNYADAMRALHRQFPDDADVAAMTAEAVMQLRPWQLWTPDGQPAPEIEEIRGILEKALARAPDHAGLCHFYIHAMEAGPEVARAVPAAERLETLAPGIGHLVHMPSHVYIWTGRYQDAVRVNQQAVAMDLAFARAERQDGFYLLYLLHNYHFIAYGGMWTGQRALALEAARDLVGKVTPEALAGMLDFLDVFTATPLHVLLRFGRWNEILAEPEPDAQLLAHRAVRHYARGVALAALGRVDEALAEQERFRKARAAVPESRMLFNNKVADILAVADAVLAGEIDYRRGDLDAAFAQLRSAVELDARLNYDEPWGWMEPARHALGALLVEQGRHAEAERVYREDLARFPENGWSLHGLAECLRATGRAAEADDVERRLRRAWQWADTALVGSCFCRTK